MSSLNACQALLKLKQENRCSLDFFLVAENSFDSNKYNLDWALKKTIEMFQRNF